MRCEKKRGVRGTFSVFGLSSYRSRAATEVEKAGWRETTGSVLDAFGLCTSHPSREVGPQAGSRRPESRREEKWRCKCVSHVRVISIHSHELGREGAGVDREEKRSQDRDPGRRAKEEKKKKSRKQLERQEGNLERETTEGREAGRGRRVSRARRC